jgi:hypothetical protein
MLHPDTARPPLTLMIVDRSVSRPHPDLPWERFWCPRGGSLTLDWSGFLVDPREPFSSEVQPELVQFESLELVPCVVLLGEPGIGKSHELSRHFKKGDGPSRTLYRNLRQYDSTLAIREDIFRSDEFRRWAEGEEVLTLALDSLDEALLEIGVLATWLIEELQRFPVERLRLRLACRTADWPSIVEHGLRGIWGDSNVRVFELAPLTHADVRLAAEARGVDADAFFAEIARNDASALANKPTTLRFLLNAFARHQALPHTKSELYRLGCLQLCEEDDERRVSGRAGSLTTGERLAIARRIAATTIFGNRAAVWRGRDPTEVPSAEIPVADLTGGTEPLEGGLHVAISDREVEETLGTGLFSGRGPESLGWAHQTYAEFLAAQWVVEHDFPIQQIESLIRHPHDLERQFVPQLRETVSWLAGMDARVRSIVLAIEPELLLDSDIDRLSDADRAAAVDALLEATTHARLRWPEFGSLRQYDRLAHPDLAEQLRPYLTDRALSNDVRELALEIARRAGADVLAGECADIALDRSEPLAVRTEAARVVATVGDGASKARLLPLALDPQEEDEQDDLKGTALRAVWPNYLTPEQLFAALGFPKIANRSGSYDVFLSELAEDLNPALLPVGLRWAVKTVDGLTMRGRLANAIIQLSWEHLDRPEVLEPFADFAAHRFADYQDLLPDDQNGVFGAAIAAHQDRRHHLVEALVERMGADVDRVAFTFTHRPHPLVTAEDFDWLLERVAECDSADQHGNAWASLLRVVCDLGEPTVFERLYSYRDRPHVSAAFARYWDPISLESPVADALRREHTELEEMRASRRQFDQPPPDLPSAERVLSLLANERLEADENQRAEAWVAAAQELTRSEDGRYYSDQPLDQGPTWQLLDESGRLCIIAAAERYARDRAGRVAEWTADAGRTMGTWAGYRALLLLASQTTERVNSVSNTVWVAWAPIIIGERPSSNDEQAVGHHKVLLARVYAAAPDLVISLVRGVLVKQDEENKVVWGLNQFEPLWGEQFGAAMLDLVRDDALSLNSFETILKELLERDVSGALSYAESLISLPLPRTKRRRSRALAAASAVLLKAPAQGWRILQPIIGRPGKFRRELALRSAYGYLPLNRFMEDQLAGIFVWLTEEFPYPDPWYVGVHSPSAEDSARRWRSNVLRALEARATPAAVDALQSLRRKFPELEWLSQTILRTREAVRRETWVAPSVPQILALAENAARRLVETGEQLLELLEESLDRLQQDLQGELPSVSALWDNLGGGKYRPKDEQELSDMIARHFRKDLHDRGVVAGREVVIRRGGAGGVPGQRTDVYVTAVREEGPRKWNTIAAIVEVKGSWHDDVLTAMETQLVGDYLSRNPECQHGLYVVGWYLCQRWMSEPRKRKSRRHGSADQLRAVLWGQAAAVTTAGRTVRPFVLDAAWR